MTEVARCPNCRKAIHASQAESWCVACGTPLGDEIANLLPSVVAQRSAVAVETANGSPAPPMTRADRLMRGMLTMGAVFAVVGFAMVGTLGVVSLIISPVDRDDVDFMVTIPFVWATIAFVLGMIYAGLLAFLARGREFREVSIWRAALAGAVTGLAPAAVVLASDLIKGHPLNDVLDPLMLFPPLSAALATVTLLVARRAR